MHPVERVRAERLLPLREWVASAASLPIQEIAVGVEMVRAGSFESPASSVLRGQFGERLRALRCLTGAIGCSGCLVLDQCDFGRLFEEVPGGDTQIARSYWFQGIPASRRLAAGARFTARLRLAGTSLPAAQYLDAALRQALETFGRDGLAARATRLAPTVARSIAMPTFDGTAPSRRWRIESASPLLLRGNDEACRQSCPRAPWMVLLARAGVRRLDGLLRASGVSDVPRVEWPRLDEVEVHDLLFEPWADSRFSRSQEQRTPFEGGRTLRAEVSGPTVDALLPLLGALTITGVGRHPTMGFGALELRAAG